MAEKIVPMKTVFIEKEFSYDGTQLCSHWILKTTGIYGDALVSFAGPANVSLAHMVDLEDVLEKKPIYSQLMLHFIAEHFDNDLEKMVLRQRLFICIVKEVLHRSLPGGSTAVVRKGDDLYVGDFKLTVSIATASAVSTLMHTGINIKSLGTPVPTKGLEDFDLNPRAFATSVMNGYEEEISGIRRARCKVRGVGGVF